MTVPTYDRFIEPILRFLARHPDGASAKSVHDAAADALGLTVSQRAELVPSGTQPVFKNRAGWAHDRLKRAGLSASPRHGFWKLTPAGTSYVEGMAGALSTSEIERLALSFIDVRLRPLDGADLHSVAAAEDGHSNAASTSPDDRLAQALDEMRASVAAELIDALLTSSPIYFESIVLDVLHRLGYGISRDDLQRVGGSGDGGIDGVISLDRLGLEKVYVQAKRWQQTVGRPEVQAFYGALAGQRAQKGVFITTSGFTAQAIDFARSVDKIVLVGGQRLAELMIDYEVGVTSRIVKIPKFDSDYFDE